MLFNMIRKGVRLQLGDNYLDSLRTEIKVLNKK